MVIVDHIYDTVQSFPVGGQEFFYKGGIVLPETGVRVRDSSGQDWEYKGIGYKVDNLFRVKGWQKI